jgi:plastocyanin
MFNKKVFILLIAIFLFACGGEEYVSYTNIIQTTTAQNMLSNATATATAEVTECTAQQGIVFQSLSDAEKKKWVTECESSFTAAAQAVGKDAAISAQTVALSLTATAEAGGEAECFGSTCEKEEVVIEIDMPEGPVLEGPVDVNIGQGGLMDPQTIKINVGTTVNWLNSKGAASSSSADEGQDDMWDSGAFNKGPFDKKPEEWSYSREFTIPGCFTYKSHYSGDADSGNFGVVCVIE